MDFTGCQMIVTLKLISAAVNYQDGAQADKVPIEHLQAAHLQRLWQCTGMSIYSSFNLQ